MTENRIFTQCRMITWVVFLRIFWNFISSLPVKRGGSLSFLVGTIGNVLVMEIGWTDVGSGGYILVSCAHSNTSFTWWQYGHIWHPAPFNKKWFVVHKGIFFFLLSDMKSTSIIPTNLYREKKTPIALEFSTHCMNYQVRSLYSHSSDALTY
jgi:hypothetical protein